jgi:hypothetical protein
MSDSKEKIFAEGFIFKFQETAPDWHVGKLSIKLDDAIAFLKKHEKNGWVNLDINESRSGKFYVELDTWEPQGKASSRRRKRGANGDGDDDGATQESSADTKNTDDDDDLPF